MTDRITFERWKKLKPVARDALLSSFYHESDNDDDGYFDLIHPSLRIKNFEDSVDSWQSVQESYEKESKFSRWSTSSRSSLSGDLNKKIDDVSKSISDQLHQELGTYHDDVLARLSEMQMNINELEMKYKLRVFDVESAKIKENPNPDLLHISGADQYANPSSVISSFASVREPAYEVFTVIDDYAHTLQRFYIQPHGAAFGSEYNDYQPSINHFINPELSPIQHLITSASSISFTFHCLIDGVTRKFTFREYPQSDKSLQEYIDDVYSEDGSDIFKRLRRNITGVSINVVTSYSGGYKSKISVSWLRLFDYRKVHDNSCFYACIRNIWKADDTANRIFRYEQMRLQLTNSPHDIQVTVDLLSKAERIFGVKFIVLGDELPEITFAKPDRTSKTYEQLEGEFHIKYHTIYYNGFDMDLTETSDRPLQFVRKGNSMTVTINQVEYHLICLSENHYSNVVNVHRPSVCIKCGSPSHTSRHAAQYDSIKLECLERLRDLLTPENYEKAQPNITSIIYDFETIVDKGELRPYSVAWCVLDGQRKYHCEVGEDCLRIFMDALHKIKGVKTIIGYNTSRFDNFFVLKSLLQEGCELSSSNTIIHNNQILSIKAKGIRVWDICQFTKSTLSQACEAFKIEESKLPFDHKYVQSVFENLGWDFIDDIGADTIKEYNIRDVQVTADLFEVVVKSLRSITGLNPLQYMTLSQLAFKHMTVHNTNNKLKLDKVPTSYDSIFESVPAGRVQMFDQKGIYLDDHEQVDANGLYQYICLNYPMPNGVIQEHEDFDSVDWLNHKDRLYLAQCDVDQSKLRIKLVGEKIKGDRINWQKDLVQDAWLWNEEIEMLESLGCPVTKKRVLIWDTKVQPFNIMNVYKDIRMKEKLEGREGGVVDLMAKLMSNAITGKCYQRNKNEDWVIVSSLSASETFKSKHHNIIFDTTEIPGKYYMAGDRLQESETIAKPRHIGCRIYAMARLYMFEHIKDLKSIKYMDTDGFIMSREEYNHHPELHHNNELGKFKIEASGDKFYLCSLKNYALCMQNPKKPICLKPPHLSKKEYKECDKEYHHNKYRLKSYHNGDEWRSKKYKGTYLNEDIYKALIEDGEVTASTERITKKFVKSTTDGYKLSTLYSRSEERIIV